MTKLIVGLAMLVTASGASAQTDFGIRVVGGGSLTPPTTVSLSLARPALGSFSLSGAASLAAQWGRVTSTLRSPAHNRRVGGVANSWHISGRAIDIARRPGVSHAQIAAAFRSAGYRLLESLDEGDHSHFAFAAGFGSGSRSAPTLVQASTPTRFMAKVPLVREPAPPPEPATFKVVAVATPLSR